MKRPFRNVQDCTVHLQAHDMKRIVPGEVHQIKRPAPAQGDQVILLASVQIELPVPRLGIGGTNGGASVVDKIPRIGVWDGDVVEPHRRGISKLVVGNQFKHN